MPTPPLVLDRAQCRTVRIASQSLHGNRIPGPDGVVRQCGFVRTLGGVDAYLAVRARLFALRRAELDGCVERAELQVLPAARGCIYLVPREDAALCLRVADHLSAARNARDLVKAGLRPGEVEALAEQVATALQQHGPATTDALRKLLPADAVRSLGERGKKVGISSPLPSALRQLEFQGRAERTPEGGRLDTERYRWRRTAKDLFAGSRLPEDPAALFGRLLARFLDWSGYATIAQFSAWAGIAQRDAKAALAHVQHVPVRLPDGAEALGATAIEERLRLHDAAASATALLPFEDNLGHLSGGVADLVDEEHLDLEVPSWGLGRPSRLGNATHLAFRALIADGRLAGFWEYDPDAKVAVPFCFRKPSKAAQKLIEDASAAISRFLDRELGHGRSFSLDTDDELRRRIARLRALLGSGARAAAKGPAGRAQAARSAAKKPAATRPAKAKTATGAAKGKPAPRPRKTARSTKR